MLNTKGAQTINAALFVDLAKGEVPHKVFCGNGVNCTLLTSGQMKCWGGATPGLMPTLY